MKFAIIAFVVLALFLTFYLTITMWIKAKRENLKKDENKTPTEPSLPTQNTEKKE